MSGVDDFYLQKQKNMRLLGTSNRLRAASVDWIAEVSRLKYSYNFTWMGRPIIQFPQDMIAMQEIIWRTKPDIIIETGVAHGGSLVFYASLLGLLGGDRYIVGIDIDIRPHNRAAIEEHPMADRIRLIEGSSTDEAVVAEAVNVSAGSECVLVVLDANHTHDHVARELELYAPLVTKGSYLVVFDTVIEDLPDDFFPDRPWGKGDNPRTAVWEFLEQSDRFEIDREMNEKLLITVAPDGYLRCVKD